MQLKGRGLREPILIGIVLVIGVFFLDLLGESWEHALTVGLTGALTVWIYQGGKRSNGG